MPIELPNLDDRKFADLVQEVRALIPRYSPTWTDHNVSDPGITLIELFAWVTETIFYRANRAHESSRARFLELLGAEFESAHPASLTLRVTATGLEDELILPAGEVFTAMPHGDGNPLKYESIEDLWLRQVNGEQSYSGAVEVWQMTKVTNERLGRSDGRPFQKFPLGRPNLVIEEREHVSIIPTVSVDGIPWTYKPTLVETSRPDDSHFTVDPRLSIVRFGNGGRKADVQGLAPGQKENAESQQDQGSGMIPPLGSEITATYHYSLGSQGNAGPGAAFSFDRDLGFEAQIESTLGSLGNDPTGLDEARKTAVGALRTSFRAITARDFENLVLSAPEFNIARAKCLPGLNLTASDEQHIVADDHVSVIIVPDSTQPKPEPSPEDLIQVHAFLDERRLITCRHHVVKPEYTEIRVQAQVVLSTGIRPDSAEALVRSRLKDFFDPLRGGPDESQAGWPFGRDVYASEVYQIIEGIDGVDHVESLVLETLKSGQQWTRADERIDVPARNVVLLMAADITVVARSGE